MLSLLVIALFVVSCAPKESTDGEEGALAGQAVNFKKIDGKSLSIELPKELTEKLGDQPFFEGLTSSKIGSVKDIEVWTKKITTNQEISNSKPVLISVSCPPKKYALSGECLVGYSKLQLIDVYKSSDLTWNCLYGVEENNVGGTIGGTYPIWFIAKVTCVTIE